ncbi:DDE transposase [Acaryochloris marina MBIC10699]|nr:DDE transposase [Acaryochloris marina MBIC10699]
MTPPRPAATTLTFIDEYCQCYRPLFTDVRSYEAFKYLHLGMMSDIKHKSLPAIARICGLANEQGLLHFLTESPWRPSALEQARLNLILQVLSGRPLTLIIDETEDRKKGKQTDYVQRQYLGNLGKVDNGIVAVTAYGVVEHMTLPLMFRVYKPKSRLQSGDVYHSKPEIAVSMIDELLAHGCQFDLVLADSLYGESGSTFVSHLQALQLPYVVAIRSNHGLWLPKEQRVRCNRWRAFEHVFSDGSCETRYIREVIYGQRLAQQFWDITTDPQNLPKASTWYVMSEIEGVKYHQIGNFYGLRNWVEYGLKQSKNELGWADFRVTDYDQIERWWQVVMSAYLMVSLHSDRFELPTGLSMKQQVPPVIETFSQHRYWQTGKGWKHLLNNLRLVIIQSLILFDQIQPWLEVFPIPRLSLGFPQLIVMMNQLHGAIPRAAPGVKTPFLSA